MAHPMGQRDSKLMPQYEYLIGQHYQTAEFEPQIASAWTIAPNGRDFNWKIRRDVPFIRGAQPTGDTVNAADVILSWEIAASIATQNVLSTVTEFGDKVDATVVNDHEIDLRLAKVGLNIPFLMSDEWAWAVVSKDHWDAKGGEEGYMTDPIGTGPWSFMDLQINQRVLHQRVENHWRQTPAFHELEVLFSPEASTRLAMLLAGEVHISEVPELLLPQAVNAGMKIEKATLPSLFTHINIHYYKPENYRNPATGECVQGRACGPTAAYDPNDPTRDARVRLALALAINREEINSTFYGNEAFPYLSYAPQWVDWFQDRWAPNPGPDGKTGAEGGWQYPYDPERAKQLIADAGYQPGDIRVNMVFTNNHPIDSQQPEIAETVARYWSDIGVETNLMSLSSSEGSAQWRKRELSEFVVMRAESIDPPCVAVGFGVYESGGGKWDYQEISDFWKTCLTLTSEEQIHQLNIEFIDWWIETVVDIPLFWLFAKSAINPAVVQEYKVNVLHIGPIRYHEYTQPVYK
jgi:ABC-type transport system substrate-binding protein